MNDTAITLSQRPVALVDAPILYARVVRPPLLAWDGINWCGAQLLDVDESSLAGIAGIVRIVVQRNFLAVVATDDVQAALGAQRLQVRWSQPRSQSGRTSDAADFSPALQTGQTTGDDPLFPSGAALIDHAYAWSAASAEPLPSWALAWYGNRDLTVWMPQADGTQPQHALRTELAALLNIPTGAITLIGTDQNNDIAADAALLSQIMKQPVHVTFDPAVNQGAASDHTLHFVSRISAVLDEAQQISAYRYRTDPSPQAAPALALLLTGATMAINDIAATAANQGATLPPYAYPTLSVGDSHSIHAASASLPIASFTAIEKAAQQAAVFAHESFVTEAALQAGTDPVAFRLQHLDDARGAKLIATVAQQGDWQPQCATPVDTADVPAGGFLAGRGFAYAHVIENQAGKTTQSWSAWIADVAYDSDSGDISVTRVVVGQDCSSSDSPSGAPVITQQLEGDAIDAARLLLQNTASFDTWGKDTVKPAASGELRVAADNLPATAAFAPSELALPSKPLAGGAAFSLPAAAAIANAIYDATGVRLREPPFSGERIRLALADNAVIPKKSARKWLIACTALASALVGLVTLALPWRAPIAPIAPPDAALYSAATISRGKLVAAAGDCVVCHTAPDGVKNAGGLALDTPFGKIYSTNITPDVETGIGNWSYAAFERAMREGIHRDGKHLYPAFPYTAFAKTSDGDLQALYAYLMAQEPVKTDLPKTKLAFPFSLRPLMAGWNLLFHKPDVYQPDPLQSVEWNRGAYLAEGLGHCGACHTPRNAMGAEKGIRAYLAGGVVDGWEAPALTSLSKAPIPWTEKELFRYLRTGFSPLHGVAAGPMGPVVAELAQLPESDVKAIAHYIASFNQPATGAAPAVLASTPASTQQALAAQIEQDNAASARSLRGNGKNIYEGACATCHQANIGPTLFGVKPSLALNTNLHSATPDNLIRVILNGINTPAHQELGYMPGFRDSFDDSQINELVGYLRGRFASRQPAWNNVLETVARLRSEPAH